VPSVHHCSLPWLSCMPHIESHKFNFEKCEASNKIQAKKKFKCVERVLWISINIFFFWLLLFCGGSARHNRSATIYTTRKSKQGRDTFKHEWFFFSVPTVRIVIQLSKETRKLFNWCTKLMWGCCTRENDEQNH
jgi:hypothetical protein